MTRLLLGWASTTDSLGSTSLSNDQDRSDVGIDSVVPRTDEARGQCVLIRAFGTRGVA